MFPPIPSWDGLHPLVIHFPIALLLVAPILLVLGLVWRRHAQGVFAAALVLMALGTVGAWVAVSTGQAAGELVIRTPEINDIILRHASLAETTRTTFTVLSALFALLLALPLILKERLRVWVHVTALEVFLVIYASATLLVANTAHLGGTLVHEQGVQAML